MVPSNRPVSRRGRASLVLALVFGLAALVALVVWVRFRQVARQDEQTVTGGSNVETQRLRELAAAYYAKDNRGKARETLAQLVDRPRPDPRDLVAAAVVELAEARTDEARALLERARALGDRSAELSFDLARVAYAEADFARAEELVREALEKAPGDVPTELFLAQILEELSAQGEDHAEEVERIYRDAIARGDQAGLTWKFTAVYRLAQLLQRSGREDEAADLFDEYDRLKERGVTSPTALQMEEGDLGRLRAPRPSGSSPTGPGALPRLAEEVETLPELRGEGGMAVVDLDEDCRMDVLAWGAHGLFVVQQGEGFTWSARALVPDAVDLALAFNVGNDDLDILYAQGGTLHLLEATRATPEAPLEWTPWTRALPALPAAPRDAIAVDYDHEGDLDVVLVGDFGARLLRNDGAGTDSPEGGFTDATEEAGLPVERALAWCLAEDLDSDQDVDLLLGGARGLFLADNLRGGRFADASARLGEAARRGRRPVVTDLDADGRPDLWFPGDGATFLGRADQPFEPAKTAGASTAVPDGARVRTADLDLDGSLDAYWLDGAVRGLQSLALPSQAGFELDPRASSTPRDVVVADLDGDLASDLVVLGEDALELRRGHQQGHAVRLRYRGKKDNRESIGAVLELRAGPIYRRVFSRGQPVLFGLGDAAEVDYVRVLWPNGVVQYDMRNGLGDRACDASSPDSFQPEGLVGSCPFLYAWDGERYAFVSDVLGITPLGLPMAPGQLVPPDHDEYVLVTAEQLAPRDGVYELQFTEELREVTYLDRIRLDVIDHPGGTEVYPNERFCFPPFPEAMIHLVASPLAPRRASDDAGRDWSSELARIDGEVAVPFQNATGQMLGLATPHDLELEFDPAAIPQGAKLRLLMTGWFYWTDASVNMAAARDPGFEFVPPILEKPDGRGGWQPIGPPVGFPAGKTKTMVIDVTDALDPADPRLRVFSTLRLYWDSIRLAVGPDTLPLAKRSLEPTSARLWRRGFSAPLSDGRANQPERFVWERLAEFPRWNPHPGRYTRLGECLPLVQSVDDQYVILASGDALTVQFDAKALPPLQPGWRRDFLVYLDGWAKDRDPNTVDALYVEPLPFHGMSAYPYGPDEHFPDDEAHRRWRREWNTREAERWIPFQAPAGAPFPGAAQR